MTTPVISQLCTHRCSQVTCVVCFIRPTLDSSAVLATALCPSVSVCHKPVLFRNNNNKKHKIINNSHNKIIIKNNNNKKTDLYNAISS